MLRMQDPAGYWWAELESNVTITAEYIMLHRFLGLDESRCPGWWRISWTSNFLTAAGPSGTGDGGEISTTVEAYLALKMAGLSAKDPRLLKAREFVLARGGALKTRVFTRIFLALFGQVSWDGIPLLPVEFMLLPPWSGLSIYEFSSWTRATVVPLMIIMAKRPVRPLPPEQGSPGAFPCPLTSLFPSTGWPGNANLLSWKTCLSSWTGFSSSTPGCGSPGPVTLRLKRRKNGSWNTRRIAATGPASSRPWSTPSWRYAAWAMT